MQNPASTIAGVSWFGICGTAAFLLGCASVIRAQSTTQGPLPDIVLHRVDSSRGLPNGIEIKSGPGTLRILALRDDLLRVTVSPSATLPEDASWAVLPQSRTVSAAVTPSSENGSVGFRTKLLDFRVDRETLAITVADRAGHVLLQEARPMRFFSTDAQGDLGFRVYESMPLNEHYFGLGDKAGPLDGRNHAYTMWNTDAYRFQEGTDPLYKAIPFFVADRAGVTYGLFLDNTWRTSFDFGKEFRDEYSFGSEGGPLDYYFLYGPAPKQVIESYAWLTGTSPLPPLWALGFQQSRYSYENEQRLQDVADRLRRDHIPADAIYMDIDYQIKNRPFTIDPAKFPNLPAFIQRLTDQHLHLVMITDLHIADAPDQGYAPYDSGMAKDEFVRNPDGSVFVGKVWPGDSVFPDFTRKESREWWGALYKQFYADGASGFWNDMNEPSVFSTATFTVPLDVRDHIDEPGFEKRVTTQREVHNVFGMLNARATYEGLLALKPNQRPFVLYRASYAGGQRYGVTWTGDTSSSWNHLRLSTPMLESLGLCGFYMVGDDVGGYAGSPPMDLLTKWLEVGAFNPFDRDHTEKFTNPQEPWVGGPAMEDVRRRYIETRYRLLPYLYTAAEEASRTGVPIMRPLFLEFPDATGDRHPLDLDAGNQFLAGRDLMVVPAPYPDELQDYAVTFPPVPWFDFWTGKLVTKNEGPQARVKAGPSNPAAVSTAAVAGLEVLQTAKIHPSIDLLPVYVRGGAILPMQPLVQSTGEKPKGPLELRVYPGPDCRGSIYQDDGITFDYQRGVFFRASFSCQSAPNGLQLKLDAPTGSYQPWWNDIDVALYDWPSASANAVYNGGRVTTTNYDVEHRVLRVRIPRNTAGAELDISAP